MSDESDRPSNTLGQSLGAGASAAIVMVIAWALVAVGLVLIFTGMLTNSITSVGIGLGLLLLGCICHVSALMATIRTVARPLKRGTTTERATVIGLLLFIAGAFVYGMVSANAFYPKLFLGGVLPPVLIALTLAARWWVEVRARRAAARSLPAEPHP